MTKEQAIALYIEWISDPLTITQFADYHGLTPSTAHRILLIGCRFAENTSAKERYWDQRVEDALERIDAMEEIEQ